MRQLTILVSVAVLALGACGREPEPTAEPVEPTTETTPPSTAEVIDAAIAGEHRSGENRARDRFRNPKETLEFFGLEPGMTVIELYPGTGWYTEVLAPIVRGRGRLVAAQFDPAFPPAYRMLVYDQFKAMLASNAAVFDEVEVILINPPDSVQLGPPGSADLVLTFRNLHTWINAGELESLLAGVAEVLKPGGVFGIVQHRADEGVDPLASAKLGYIPESFVIEKVTAAGLAFDARSEINANPKDTKDHTIGVWALPPSLRGDMELREEKRAIGESDRMTIRFVKPGG